MALQELLPQEAYRSALPLALLNLAEFSLQIARNKPGPLSRHYRRTGAYPYNLLCPQVAKQHISDGTTGITPQEVSQHWASIGTSKHS